MEGKFTVVVDYGVTCICSALKSDDDIGILCKHIGDLAFSFITPVSAYDRCDHLISAFQI